MIQYRMHRTEYFEIDQFEQDRYNERMDFIEDFCANLNESRFAQGRTSPLVINFTDEPEFERGDAFYDLTGDGWGSPCKLFAEGLTHDQLHEIAYRNQTESDLAAARANAASANNMRPANTARGSPN